MKPIGTIETPHTSLADMPIQPGGASAICGRVRLLPEFIPGLKDLSGFSHIYLIYQFHKAERTELSVIPFMDTVHRGVFATRSPLRPNHIGLSLVRLLSVDPDGITFEGADILNDTPLLDIKPFIPAFDRAESVRTGWMNSSCDEVDSKRSDDRFR